jgi:hypothetical protein
MPPSLASRSALLLGALLTLLPVSTSVARAAATPPSAPPGVRDGQHDFDFEIGTWKTHLRRLLHPLTGATTWVEYDGTSVVRRVLGGKANLVELVVDGPAGHFEGLSLRLYDPKTRQWSLNFAAAGSNRMATPTVGSFVEGRGEFYDRELLDGRAILVRFLVMPLGPDSCRFEQAFSADGGKSWEVNWIAIDSRVGPEPGTAP